MKLAAGKKPVRQKLIESCLVDRDAIEGSEEKEIILSIEGSTIKTNSVVEVGECDKKLLVIPLPPPRRYEQTKSSEDASVTATAKGNDFAPLPTTAPLSLEEQATRELLGEAMPGGVSLGSVGTDKHLVIECTTTTLSSSTSPSYAAAESKNDDNLDAKMDTQHSQQHKKSAPLLMANLAPELLGIQSDDERFKKDISLRAEDMDFTSNRYKSIPVNEFGAAMLRGMHVRSRMKA
jgi:hypothetical protein